MPWHNVSSKPYQALRACARWASSSIFEGRAHKAEMAVATEIQSRLFPREFPHDNGLSVAAYHKPARAVGGDYYDLFSIGDGHYCIVVADVSGKGVPAAILMSSIRTQIRTLAPRGLPPSTTVSYMNEALHKDTELSQYATLFFGTIDLNDGSLTYVNAGHVAPLINGQMGTRRRLQTGGMPVGVFSGSHYEQGTELFGSGDRLVLYTDGVSDAGPNMGECLGDEELELLVGRHQNDSVDVLLNSILNQVSLRQSKTEQPDDITLLIVDCNAA